MKALSSVETYLQDFHQRQPGATTAAFAHRRARSSVADYASSYAAVAACVPESTVALTVLDLACGDGHLLELLSDQQAPSLRLIGVDMSQGELDVARATLPNRVALLNERAQELSVETGSVDCVLSHMAIMLMDDIEQVIKEIRRVLRPQGQFATVVGREFLLGEANKVLHGVLLPILKEEGNGSVSVMPELVPTKGGPDCSSTISKICSSKTWMSIGTASPRTVGLADRNLRYRPAARTGQSAAA